MRTVSGIIRGSFFAVALLVASPMALADDADDVMAVVTQWAALENDLDAQAELIRDDRIQIFEMNRQSNQAANMALQKAQVAARERASGGPNELHVRVESPIVRVYGNTAVVSFVRQFTPIPYNQGPMPTTQAFFTMVLVKEGGDWKIAHLHGSSN